MQHRFGLRIQHNPSLTDSQKLHNGWIGGLSLRLVSSSGRHLGSWAPKLCKLNISCPSLAHVNASAILRFEEPGYFCSMKWFKTALLWLFDRVLEQQSELAVRLWVTTLKKLRWVTHEFWFLSGGQQGKRARMFHEVKALQLQKVLCREISPVMNSLCAKKRAFSTQQGFT